MISYDQFDKYKKYSRVLLLFSGGLDTSFLLKYFTNELKCEVIAVSFNLTGSKNENLILKKNALQLGATKYVEIDATEEFLVDYCLPALNANARYRGMHPLSSSLSRPLMAKLSLKLARELKCNAVMHGSSGLQNNCARFNNAFNALTCELDILTPVLDLSLKREDEFQYLKSQGIVIDRKEDELYSSDENIWSCEIEDGNLENPTFETPNEIYKYTTSIENAPNEPEFIEIKFNKGNPVALNGIKLPLIDIVKKLNQIGGRHGVGRFDFFEDRVSGIKMREIHESPAAHILILAHGDLENSLLPKRLLNVKNHVDQLWTENVCFGFWHHPLKNALDAFIQTSNDTVNGSVKIKLHKGNAIIVARNIYIVHSKVIPNRNFFDVYGTECSV